MRVVKILSVMAMVMMGVAGCASGPYDRAGYTAVEKDGRLYVFIANSGAHQTYNKTGDMGKAVTRVGAGPNKMTVVAAEGVNVDKYIAAFATK